MPLLIFAAALLYSSVGLAGASGYMAAMALFGITPDLMKPTALTLNILVAGIAAVKFYRSGYFSWPIFWPFALTSIPFAFIGGYLTLPSPIYNQIVGAVLLFSAYYVLRRSRTNEQKTDGVPPFFGLAFGAAIGLLAGLTGLGGGIFLSPLLLFLGGAETRQVAGVVAVFNLVNSAAGLLGHLSSIRSLPESIISLGIAAAFGGIIGAELGSRWLTSAWLRVIFAVVLVIAGLKLILV